ncbi:hypothetical protein SmJEL517_g01455 [Synchytrium microbalum]|uniref:Cyclin-dependent kinases regulatory subunit n=1 Tax=Synchytrium microbalum TaxID=1806994 RepID=A0A507C5T4_9FUNG|nr:uncharacterized protein SmJEL517_g01455 [Synchytrium microbalum]TPX36377.1 hypothetical protein SmJEL517_g01455 [Synchytrium microbalum]
MLGQNYNRRPPLLKSNSMTNKVTDVDIMQPYYAFLQSHPDLTNNIYYSPRYSDDHHEYRHVILPLQLFRAIPEVMKDRLLTEQEWRSLGITQSLGWEHYEIHKPEPHIFMFKRDLEKPSSQQMEIQSTQEGIPSIEEPMTHESELEPLSEGMVIEDDPRILLEMDGEMCEIVNKFSDDGEASKAQQRKRTSQSQPTNDDPKIRRNRGKSDQQPQLITSSSAAADEDEPGPKRRRSTRKK